MIEERRKNEVGRDMPTEDSGTDTDESLTVSELLYEIDQLEKQNTLPFSDTYIFLVIWILAHFYRICLVLYFTTFYKITAKSESIRMAMRLLMIPYVATILQILTHFTEHYPAIEETEPGLDGVL